VKIAALVTFVLIAPFAARAETIALVNPGFEEPPIPADIVPGWNPQQHAGDPAYEFALDTKTFAKGKQAFRLTRFKEEEYAVLDQRVAIPKFGGQDVEFTALVRTKDVGPKGFTLCLNFLSSDGSIMQQVKSQPITGTIGKWTPVKVSAKVPVRTFYVEPGFLLLDGGTIWADEATLKTVGGKTVVDPKKAAADARKADEARKPDPAKQPSKKPAR